MDRQYPGIVGMEIIPLIYVLTRFLDLLPLSAPCVNGMAQRPRGVFGIVAALESAHRSGAKLVANARDQPGPGAGVTGSLSGHSASHLCGPLADGDRASVLAPELDCGSERVARFSAHPALACATGGTDDA